MAGPRATVLIVDDEQDLLEIFRMEFEDRGCHVMTASNGHDAFNLVNKNKFDIVITDICMPGMDGAELLKKIENKKGQKPFVLAMSGYNTYGPDQLAEYGSVGYLSKPFSHAQIVELIENYIVLLDKSAA